MTVEEIVRNRLGVEPERIAEFCRKWQIKELSLFGSVLTDEFRSDSDVDLLVRFVRPVRWTLWDFIDMKDELVAMFGRPVDLMTEPSLKNPFRRHSILTSRRILYAA